MKTKKTTTIKKTAPAAVQMVTVTALANLYEADTHRKKGEVFEMPADRAAVLPELVSTVDTPATDA